MFFVDHHLVLIRFHFFISILCNWVHYRLIGWSRWSTTFIGSLQAHEGRKAPQSLAQYAHLINHKITFAFLVQNEGPFGWQHPRSWTPLKQPPKGRSKNCHEKFRNLGIALFKVWCPSCITPKVMLGDILTGTHPSESQFLFYFFLIVASYCWPCTGSSTLVSKYTHKAKAPSIPHTLAQRRDCIDE